MEKEPLLPYLSLRRKPTPLVPILVPLPEHNKISLPLTPYELKNCLIFGPSSSSPQDACPLVDALNLLSWLPKTLSSSTFIDLSTQQDPQSQSLLQSPQGWLFNPNNPRTKINLHRSKTVLAMAVINEINHSSVPIPPFGSQSIVRQVCILFMLYLFLGVKIYWFNKDNFSANETYSVVDALYFYIVTMCTIGYSDITPASTTTVKG